MSLYNHDCVSFWPILTTILPATFFGCEPTNTIWTQATGSSYSEAEGVYSQGFVWIISLIVGVRLAVIDGRGPIKDATVAVVSEIPSIFLGLMLEITGESKVYHMVFTAICFNFHFWLLTPRSLNYSRRGKHARAPCFDGPWSSVLSNAVVLGATVWKLVGLADGAEGILQYRTRWWSVVLLIILILG